MLIEPYVPIGEYGPYPERLRQQFEGVIRRFRTDGRAGSGGRCLRKRRIKAVIPEKRGQSANRKKKGRQGGRPVSHDVEFCTERNTVERLMCATRRLAASPAQSGGIGGTFLGLMAHLDPKGDGDQSMPDNQ